MNEQERYLFDLQGFLVVEHALTPAEVDELNAGMDRHIAESVPPEASTFRFGNLLDWGSPFRKLIDNSRMVPYLEAALGSWFRLDHEYADLIRRGKGPIGTQLHGGATPFDPSEYYTVKDGQIRCGLTVVAYSLKDVEPGDGGFAAVPGSHKSNYPFPPDWIELETSEPRPFVRPVVGPAGTAVIFTEALSHGTLPWRGKGERRTLFFKYAPHSMAWSARYYRADRYDDLTERQRAILEPPNARYAGRSQERE